MNLNKLSGQKLYVSDKVSCPTSRISVDRYADFIIFHGAALTSSIEEANIVLIDTCAFNKEKEQISLDLIRREQNRAHSEAKVIVCGCLVGINPQVLQETFRGHYFSPQNEEQLSIILGVDDTEEQFFTPFDLRGRYLGVSDVFLNHSKSLWLLAHVSAFLHQIDHYVPLHRVPFLGKLLSASQGLNKHAYAITISQGCVGNCSFCVIPKAKGHTRSLPVGMIVERVRQVVKEGAKHICLMSEDTGAYGCDIGTSIVDLLDRIHEIPGNFKIHIAWFDPRWLPRFYEDLMRIFAQRRIIYFQAPLQSASSSVLARMQRAYRAEVILPLLKNIRISYPWLSLGTQLIAGFPGETVEEFYQTKKMLEKPLFDHVFVYEFSRRPGAQTEGMSGHLPQEVVKAYADDLRRTWRTTRIKTLLGIGKKWNTKNKSLKFELT